MITQERNLCNRCLAADVDIRPSFLCLKTFLKRWRYDSLVDISLRPSERPWDHEARRATVLVHKMTEIVSLYMLPL